MIDLQFGLAPLFLLLIFLVVASIKILREYERGVIFLLGRFWKVKGPGLVIVIPGIQQMVKVDLRVVTMDVPSQDVISRDNVSVKVNAIVFFRVVDPEKAIIQVENFLMATSQLAQTTLRAVLGKHELDEMLAERERLNLDVQQILDAQTDSWGIKVANVEIKHIDLNESMVRAIARQAEAERERLELEFKQKARDFQFQSKELNEAKAISDRDMLKQLKPKLDKAVEEVIKQGNYDLVLERGAVVDVKPQYEITRQVIERMNSQR